MKVVFRTEVDLDNNVIYYSNLINVLVAIQKLVQSKVDYLRGLDYHDERVVGKILVFDEAKKTYVPLNNNSQEFPIKGLEITMLPI
ncbi:MAG: hypothetical protein JNJ40_18080 [Bacteroidia bacterium]|nr:hypothetical protein [Bacteroidia bacterium]